MAQKYTDALGQLASSANAKTIMVPLEAGSLIGSVAGISEIVRESLSASRAKTGGELE